MYKKGSRQPCAGLIAGGEFEQVNRVSVTRQRGTVTVQLDLCSEVVVSPWGGVRAECLAPAAVSGGLGRA